MSEKFCRRVSVGLTPRMNEMLAKIRVREKERRSMNPGTDAWMIRVILDEALSACTFAMERADGVGRGYDLVSSRLDVVPGISHYHMRLYKAEKEAKSPASAAPAASFDISQIHGNDFGTALELLISLAPPEVVSRFRRIWLAEFETVAGDSHGWKRRKPEDDDPADWWMSEDV